MTPPQNPDAEAFLLGAMLLSDGTLEPVRATGLRPEMFYSLSNGRIFQAILDVADRGAHVDPVTVGDQLDACGRLEESGGRTRLHEFAVTGHVPGNASNYARMVVEAWQRREIASALENAAAGVLDGDVAESLERAESTLVNVRSVVERGRSAVVPMAKAADDLREHLASPPDPRGVDTPFRKVAAMKPGRVYVLGGYPKDGKTALASQFVKRAAKDGKKVGLVTLEMSWRDLRNRMLGTVKPHDVEDPRRLSDRQRELVHHATAEMKTWNVDLIDDPTVTPVGLRRYQRLGGYDLLVIDHLHRFQWRERRDLEQAVQAITNLALEEQVPILLLAQVNRRGSEFPPPTMADLRESGMIEAEASAVWFIWRKRDKEGARLDEAQLRVDANRFGAVGKVDLFFNSSTMEFTEVDGWRTEAA